MASGSCSTQCSRWLGPILDQSVWPSSAGHGGGRWFTPGSQSWLHSEITWGALKPGALWVAAGHHYFFKSPPSNTAPDVTLFAGLIVTANKNLDREKQAKYEIVVEARDAQGLRGESGTATVLISLQDVNDNFPIFTQCEPLP